MLWTKYNKGEFLYLPYIKKRMLLQTSLMFLFSLAVLGIGYYSFGSFKNYFTIFSVLGILPATRSLVHLIALLRVRTIEYTIFQKYNSTIQGSSLSLNYNLYFTSETMNYSVPLLFVSEQRILGCTFNSQTNIENLKSHLKLYLKKDGFDIKNIQIIPDEKRFYTILKSHLAYTADTQDKNIEHTLKLLSL